MYNLQFRYSGQNVYYRLITLHFRTERHINYRFQIKFKSIISTDLVLYRKRIKSNPQKREQFKMKMQQCRCVACVELHDCKLKLVEKLNEQILETLLFRWQNEMKKQNTKRIECAHGNTWILTSGYTNLNCATNAIGQELNERRKYKSKIEQNIWACKRTRYTKCLFWVVCCVLWSLAQLKLFFDSTNGHRWAH